ncbi:hypothetical protein BGY98DRAFT_85730 [Russula aff. rugulosa BPL654]|nr:hypothetical protein BGY98DRAFT_85730 [Russula aff. rugulosa BPL654]
MPASALFRRAHFTHQTQQRFSASGREIELEKALEAESESHVNRLSRELSANTNTNRMEDPPALSGSSTAVLAQEKMATAPNRLPFSVCPVRSESLRVPRTYWNASQDAENENPIVDTERKFIRVTRLTVVKYTVQEELIQHRRRLASPRRQPDRFISPRSILPAYAYHRRSSSNTSSPSTSIVLLPMSGGPP